jgi:hypothetical protein
VTERRRHTGARRCARTVLPVVVGLAASLLWLAALPGTPAQGAVNRPGPAHAQPADASGPTGAHDGVRAHAHKEGTVAVVASVIGIIAVIVLVVLLGSISVRRRTRDGPQPRRPLWRGPPDRGRGFFG